MLRENVYSHFLLRFFSILPKKKNWIFTECIVIFFDRQCFFFFLFSKPLFDTSGIYKVKFDVWNASTKALVILLFCFLFIFFLVLLTFRFFFSFFLVMNQVDCVTTLNRQILFQFEHILSSPNIFSVNSANIYHSIDFFSKFLTFFNFEQFLLFCTFNLKCLQRDIMNLVLGFLPSFFFIMKISGQNLPLPFYFLLCFVIITQHETEIFNRNLMLMFSSATQFLFRLRILSCN